MQADEESSELTDELGSDYDDELEVAVNEQQREAD